MRARGGMLESLPRFSLARRFMSFLIGYTEGARESGRTEDEDEILIQAIERGLATCGVEAHIVRGRKP